MARRRRNVRRDKYGRFRGKGAIKPWKNNLQGVTRKGAPNKGVRKARRGFTRSKAKAAGVVAAQTAMLAASTYSAVKVLGSTRSTLKGVSRVKATAGQKTSGPSLWEREAAFQRANALPSGVSRTNMGMGFKKTPANKIDRKIVVHRGTRPSSFKAKSLSATSHDLLNDFRLQRHRINYKFN